jgi:hypothetical protein
MSHWYVQGRLGHEHRADLDREADRVALTEQIRARGRATPTRGILEAAIRVVALIPLRRPRTADRADRPLLELDRDV